ncbi:MAG: GNAT family N-acetyltransferase [Roseiflexaceae bacterium]
MTITIHSLTAADLNRADAIQQAAYGGESRKDRLQLYLSLQPDGWLLAMLDGEPAGIAGGTNYGTVGHIGLVAVEPSKQRRGVALALMEHLLGWFDHQDCPLIQLDASDAGVPLYRKLGFVEDEKTLGFTQGNCALRPAQSERVGRLQVADIPALVAFDAPIFGGDRAAVFAAALAATPERAFVARDSAGQISGYLFAQALVLGPWAARTPADAEALLAAALTLPFDGAIRTLTPGSNVDAANLLMRYGFSPQRLLHRMRRGSVVAAGQRSLLYGQSSLAIG